MQAILNQMKFQAALNGNSSVTALRGLVTGFNPQAWKITVTFYPLTDEDGYAAGTVEIPLASTWVGNGWGAYFAPALNTQVTILFENSDYQIPIGMLFNFDSDNNPLQGVQSGEAWLAHQSGSVIKLTNDGNVSVVAENALNLQGETVNIIATQEINLQAPVVNASQDMVVTNNLSANDGQATMEDGVFNAVTLNASNDVTAASVSLHGHVHGGVTGGSDSTEPPTT
jgi:hypothetical protein